MAVAAHTTTILVYSRQHADAPAREGFAPMHTVFRILAAATCAEATVVRSQAKEPTHERQRANGKSKSKSKGMARRTLAPSMSEVQCERHARESTWRATMP